MALKKITAADLAGKGVVGMADVPGLPREEMQYKVEEIVRDVVIPALNHNADNTATKEELQQAVFDAGAGDMAAAVYDTNNDGIVNSADNGFFTYIHTKEGTVHNLAGSGGMFRFTATAPWEENDSLTVNGSPARVYNTNGGRSEGTALFAAGAVVCGAVEYTAEGDAQYRVYPFKSGVSGGVNTDGNTVTPVDDVTLWQQCAGMDTQYTVSRILADEAVLARLLGDHNAINYFIRSKNIQAAVLADSKGVEILDRIGYRSISCNEDKTMPYGSLSHSDNDYSYQTAYTFRTLDETLSTGKSSYFGPGWVQWNFGDRIGEKWIYRVQFANTTGKGGVMCMGVTRDGQTENLMAVENTTGNAIVQEIAIPTDKKYVAFRLQTSANAYLSQCKFWGL